MNITLYASPMSSATPVVQALAELALPHELVTVDLSTGDQRKPEFLARNPNGKVPTLVADGTPMFETLAIIQWLGDRFGVERGLWPAADAPARLQALAWSTWAYVTYGSVLSRLNLSAGERAPAELRSEAYAKHSHAQLQELLGVLDGQLAPRDYLLGDGFSLVDLIVGGVVTWGAFCGVSVADHAHVQAWLERLHARPAHQKVWAMAAA